MFQSAKSVLIKMVLCRIIILLLLTTKSRHNIKHKMFVIPLNLLFSAFSCYNYTTSKLPRSSTSILCVIQVLFFFEKVSVLIIKGYSFFWFQFPIYFFAFLLFLYKKNDFSGLLKWPDSVVEIWLIVLLIPEFSLFSMFFLLLFFSLYEKNFLRSCKWKSNRKWLRNKHKI